MVASAQKTASFAMRRTEIFVGRAGEAIGIRTNQLKCQRLPTDGIASEQTLRWRISLAQPGREFESPLPPH